MLKGLANLSGGRVRCRFTGMVGSDGTARAYRQMLEQQGVQPLLLVSSRVRGRGVADRASASRCTRNRGARCLLWHTHQ